MGLICVKTKAEYFSIPGLTRFRKIRSDLLVGSVCRTYCIKMPLYARQISLRYHGHDASEFANGACSQKD